MTAKRCRDAAAILNQISAEVRRIFELPDIATFSEVVKLAGLRAK